MEKKTKNIIPAHFRKFVKDYPKVAASYSQLSKACKSAGPLNKKTAALVKLGIAIGSKREGSVHSHTRQCLEAGVRETEIRHTVILALTTIGFSSMMAALCWVNDVLEQQ
jgi:4-carboxymuconolactone decarboxylase